MRCWLTFYVMCPLLAGNTQGSPASALVKNSGSSSPELSVITFDHCAPMYNVYDDLNNTIVHWLMTVKY